MAKVTIKNLKKIYGNNVVVNNISAEIPDGTLVSILGPSGCGKTTTLRMIAGFEEADGGEILFDNEDITSVKVNKRNIGMVFQSYALFPHMTVEQNVAYGLEQRNYDREEIRKRVAEALKKVHMEEYAARKPKQLSGGQQQRVALARALVIEPDVLLLDECLSALDKKLRVEMQAELRKILEETGVTTFFVTHDQEEAMTLSDYIIVMNNGVIEQMGSPKEVYEHPRNSFVAGFLGKANFFERGGKIYAVRPENVQLRLEKDLNTKKSGTVSFVTYSGNLTTYTVESEDKKIVAEMQSGSNSENIVKGSHVFAGWTSEDEILLEE